jgi:hypothetical protein
VLVYLVLIEITKKIYFATTTHVSIPQDGGPRRGHQHQLVRRAGRFSLGGPLPRRDSSA